MKTIKTALLSVYDKTGLVDFARQLHDQGIELLSTAAPPPRSPTPACR